MYGVEPHVDLVDKELQTAMENYIVMAGIGKAKQKRLWARCKLGEHYAGAWKQKTLADLQREQQEEYDDADVYQAMMYYRMEHPNDLLSDAAVAATFGQNE